MQYQKQIDEKEQNLSQNDNIKQDQQNKQIQEDQQNTNNQQQQKHDNLRWVLLILAVFSSTAGQVGFVFPSYFNITLKSILDINDLQFNLLFSIQCAPNIILPFFTGLLPKYFGLGNSLIAIQFIQFVGLFLQFFSIFIKSYSLLIFARLLVGIGFVNYSTLLVVQITQWFIGKEIGFACSCLMTTGKVFIAIAGFFFSFWSGPENQNIIYQPLLWLLLFAALNLIACLLVIQIDKKMVNHKQQKDKNNENNTQKKEKSSLEIVKSLGTLYWLIIIVGSMVNSIYYPYINNIQVFNQEKYQITGPISNFCYVIAIFIAAITAPFTGSLCDSTGNFRKIWSISSIFCILPFAYYYFDIKFQSETLTAIIPPILIGFYYGTANIIRQPCVRFAVEPDSYSVATGLSVSFINGVLAIFPIVFGYVLNMGTDAVTIFMIGFALVYLISSLFLQFYDMKHDNLLINHVKYKNNDANTNEEQEQKQKENKNQKQ